VCQCRKPDNLELRDSCPVWRRRLGSFDADDQKGITKKGWQDALRWLAGQDQEQDQGLILISLVLTQRGLLLANCSLERAPVRSWHGNWKVQWDARPQSLSPNPSQCGLRGVYQGGIGRTMCRSRRNLQVTQACMYLYKAYLATPS
jgi:hypothetical protein